MPATRSSLCLFALAAVTACTGGGEPQRYLRLYDTFPSPPDRLRICARADCRETREVQLSPREQRRLAGIFAPAPADGREERERIARAVALLEAITGDQTGTSADRPAGQHAWGPSRQLDCVAETTNTTVYLLFLQQQGLLRWHRTRYPEHRGFVDLMMPHNTAVVRDLQSGGDFAVDAYYHANGEPPEVVPLPAWKAGYRPPADTH